MSAFFDCFSSLCRENGETPNSVGKKLGIPSGSITAWRNGTIPRVATLDKIANFFGVSTDFLRGVEPHSPIIQCKDCGFTYNSSVPNDIRQHEKRHKTWELAVQKFGFCWSYLFREREKADARNKILSGNLSDEEYIEAQTTVFKALFSRSLEGCDYDLRHVSFKDYVAMLLNQKQWKNEIPPHIYMKLSSRFGIKNGIPAGSYYQTKKAPTGSGEREMSDDELKVAYFRGADPTLTREDMDAMWQDAKNFRDFIVEKRKREKNGN